MAANFWTSSHYKQLLDPEEVDVVHAVDKEKGLTQEEFKLIKIHMTNHIWRLAQQVKVRQRVIATAVAYFRRVYTRKSMTEYDPRLVAPTCLYLASKAEESTVQARLLVFYIKKMCADDKYRFEIKDILEMEMKLLEALDYYLVVFHPYRALLHFKKFKKRCITAHDFGCLASRTSLEDTYATKASGVHLEEAKRRLLQDANMTDLTHISWGLVNDTYKMDLILIYPPHMIALACIYIASVLKDKETTAWFEELRVDMNVVKNISMEILDFYDSRIETFKGIPEAYNRSMSEEKVNAALNKLAIK